jgi:hypothetical protein
MFLHGALTDLHAWNQTPGAHPITAACWFIYADDPGWTAYSIAGLHDQGPPGSDQDLWDALQYACTLDLPAGVADPGAESMMIPGLPAGENVAPLSAAVTTSSIYSILFRGINAIDGVVSATSKWVSQDVPAPHWLQLDLGAWRNLAGVVVHHAGAGGEASHFNTQAFRIERGDTASGPWSVDAAVANPAQAATSPRAYRATTPARHLRIWITDPGVDNIARIPEVEVFEAPPGDLNANGRLDASDVAALTACLSGPGSTHPPVGCDAVSFQMLDLDRDGAVSLSDVAVIQQTPL